MVKKQIKRTISKRVELRDHILLLKFHTLDRNIAKYSFATNINIARALNVS
jgi:hypothetical protein